MPMDLDELLALMSAKIYGARLTAYYCTLNGKKAATRPRWEEQHVDAMRASLNEARELWAIVRQRQSGGE